MDVRTYIRAIVPIGVLYSASLVCSNQAYLYLSVALIQMLKVILSFFPTGLGLKLSFFIPSDSIRHLGKLTTRSTSG